MELPKIDKIDIQYLDQWFANLADTINYDLSQIEGAVGALVMQLTNIDAAPTQYLDNSLDKLVTDINDGFDKINEQFKSLEDRIKGLEDKNNVVV